MSIAVFLGGSQVLGVVPKALAKRDIIRKIIGEKLQVFTMSDWMNAMFTHVGAFIPLPCGLGTLKEIFHISSWAQLHIYRKPIGFLNVNGFCDNLLSFLDQVVEQKFLTSSAGQIIISTATVEQLLDQLQSFIPIIDPSISRINWLTMESRKTFILELSLRFWNLVSFDFINIILFCFVISYIYLSVFQVCQCSLFQVMSFILYLSTLEHWWQCLVLVGGKG